MFEARDPAQAVQAIQIGLKHAVAGQPGPVAVILHSLALAGSVDGVTRPRLYRSESYVQPRTALVEPDVSSVTDALRQAERPVIIAGGGIRSARAQSELRRLAELTNARVMPT